MFGADDWQSSFGLALRPHYLFTVARAAYEAKHQGETSTFQLSCATLDRHRP